MPKAATFQTSDRTMGTPKNVEREVGEPGNKVEDRTGFCQPAVAADALCGQQQSRKQRKGLGKVTQCAVEPTGDAGERC